MLITTVDLGPPVAYTPAVTRPLRRPRPGGRAMRAPQIGFAQLVQDFFLHRLSPSAAPAPAPWRPTATRSSCCWASRATHRETSLRARSGRPGRAARAGLPRPPRNRARQQRPHPQRPAGRDPLVHARYAALRDPTCLPISARVLAIPAKRFDRPVLGYLSREQIAAILAAPDRKHLERPARHGPVRHRLQHRRPRLRTHPPAGPRRAPGPADCVHLHGKGRKHRAIPLWKNNATELRGWLGTSTPRRGRRCSPAASAHR
jgi:integrase/recombinase XerD